MSLRMKKQIGSEPFCDNGLSIKVHTEFENTVVAISGFFPNGGQMQASSARRGTLGTKPTMDSEVPETKFGKRLSHQVHPVCKYNLND